MNAPSAGPAFKEVAKKYRDDKTAIAKLANKIITGGGGLWGDREMSAHPQLSREETTEMVKYILSLGSEPVENRIAPKGTVALKEHVGKEQEGRYVITASYTDKGSLVAPAGKPKTILALNKTATLVLRPNRVYGAEADELHNLGRQDKRLGFIHNGSYFVLKNIDLKGINELTYKFSSRDKAANVEVHTGSPTGPVVSTLSYSPTGAWDKYAEQTVGIQAATGKQDLYFVFTKKDTPNKDLCSLEWIEFK